MADEGVRKLYGFNGTETFDKTFPRVSIESVLLYVFAYGMWIIENLFDRHRAQVDQAINNLKPHTLRWYVNKAMAFQIDDQLPTDRTGQTASDVYATINPKKQIVRYAVADDKSGVILLKLAKYRTMDDHRPMPLQEREVEALRHYFAQIKDAGVPISITSPFPDLMKLEATIYYNPMVLHSDVKNKEEDLYNATSSRGLVRKAIEEVIENLTFNGTCKKSDLLKAIYAIEGVDVTDITSLYTAEAPASSDEALELTEVTGYCTPKSGYFRLNELLLTLKPYEYGSPV